MNDIKKLLGLSKEACNNLMRVGGMLNQDLAYDIMKIVSKIERKYDQSTQQAHHSDK